MDAASDGGRLWPTGPPPPPPPTLVVGFDSQLQKLLMRFVRKRNRATRGGGKNSIFKFPIRHTVEMLRLKLTCEDAISRIKSKFCNKCRPEVSQTVKGSVVLPQSHHFTSFPFIGFISVANDWTCQISEASSAAQCDVH